MYILWYNFSKRLISQGNQWVHIFFISFGKVWGTIGLKCKNMVVSLIFFNGVLHVSKWKNVCENLQKQQLSSYGRSQKSLKYTVQVKETTFCILWIQFINIICVVTYSSNSILILGLIQTTRLIQFQLIFCLAL